MYQDRFFGTFECSNGTSRLLQFSSVFTNTFFFIPVPVEAPVLVNVTAQSSTSVAAFWELSKLYYSKRNLISFKLLYQKESSSLLEIQTIKDAAWVDAKNVSVINGSLVFSMVVTGLEKFTEYEFKVCVFSSVGCGRNSSSKIARTWEDGKGLCHFIRFNIVNWVHCRELQQWNRNSGWP